MTPELIHRHSTPKSVGGHCSQYIVPNRSRWKWDQLILKLLSRQLILIIAVSFWTSAASAIVSATLPSSRSVQVDSTATIFATVFNLGQEAATGCAISLATVIDAELFFQTTDPATNTLTRVPNEPVDIAPLNHSLS